MINAVKYIGCLLFKAVILGDLMVIWASLCRENKIKLQPGFFLFVLFFLPVAPAKLYLVKHAKRIEH